MEVIFSQQLILFVFVVAGYLLCKTGTVKQEHSRILSAALVYVFLPCNVFKTFSSRFTTSYIAQNSGLLLLSVCLILGIMAAAHLIAKLLSKNSYERVIYEYSMVIPNYGYMGYALAEALLGEAGLMNLMAFALPASLYIYTVGYARLTKSGFRPKSLLSPTIIATVLGIGAGLLELPVPEIVTTVMTKASACMAPVSMLLTGIVIAGFPLKKILSNPKIYPLTAIRLVALPMLGLLLRLFCDTAAVQTAVLFLALPCGLNTVVFPKLVDENCELGAGIALVSTVLACITLPLILSLFGIGML